MSSLVLFAALSAVLMWPLLVHPTTAMPGTAVDHDVVSFVWNLWWTKHALFELHRFPLRCGYVLAPFGADLRLHTYSLLHGLVSLPLQPLLGVVGAFNAITFATLVANGWSVSGLTLEWLEPRHRQASEAWKAEAALMAGALALLAPAVVFHLRVGRPSFGSIWPIALALAALLRLARTGRRSAGTALGACLVAALLIDYQTLLFAICSLLLLLGWLGLDRRRIHDRFAAGLALASILLMVPFLGVYYPALANAATQGYPVPSAADTLVYSHALGNFASVPFLRSTLGAVPLVLGTVALVRWRRSAASRCWIVLAACFVVLSLGVVLRPTSLPLPFALLRMLPGGEQFRTPYRFAVPASVALAVAGGVASAAALASITAVRVRWLALAAMVAAAAVDVASTQPFRAQEYAELDVYRRIADQAGSETVLEVPFGVRSGTEQIGDHETLQYYQMVHAKPGVNAMIARVPRRVFEAYAASPSLRLLADQPLAEPAPAGLEAELDSRLAWLGVRWVVVHLDLLTRHREAILRLLDANPTLSLVDERQHVRLYERRPTGG